MLPSVHAIAVGRYRSRTCDMNTVSMFVDMLIVYKILAPVQPDELMRVASITFLSLVQLTTDYNSAMEREVDLPLTIILSRVRRERCSY